MAHLLTKGQFISTVHGAALSTPPRTAGSKFKSALCVLPHHITTENPSLLGRQLSHALKRLIKEFFFFIQTLSQWSRAFFVQKTPKHNPKCVVLSLNVGPTSGHRELWQPLKWQAMNLIHGPSGCSCQELNKTRPETGLKRKQQYEYKICQADRAIRTNRPIPSRREDVYRIELRSSWEVGPEKREHL